MEDSQSGFDFKACGRVGYRAIYTSISITTYSYQSTEKGYTLSPFLYNNILAIASRHSIPVVPAWASGLQCMWPPVQ